MPASGPDWTGLLQRVVDGDGLAFVQASRLVNGFLVRWNAYAFREEWDDLVQEVIAAGALALRDGRLRDPQAAVAFLRTTARFKFVDRLRIQLRVGSGEGLAWDELVASREHPLEEQFAAAAREDLRRALARIPEKKREAVTSVYVGGMSYEEAARATGLPLGTLKRYLRDALAQLRDELSDSFDEG
jgi:RNA polymerase sigma-70 factor (ECF subfamily)